MKKIFLITLIGISVFSYGQKTFKLCTIEERKLDTIANFFNVSKEESAISGKLVIGPTNFTLYVGKKIVFNQKLINFDKTLDNAPFFQFTHKNNEKIYIMIMDKTPYSPATIITCLDGITRYSYKECK
ncbi:hypothetical protein [Flavobacterium sp.]|jgi:hypothetical protein|uniref:hypothetical protein n=1 Tax=Flavobacterium sp. TaxID=239 RepID=UPI00322BFF9F